MADQRTFYTKINKVYEPFMVDVNRYNVLYGSAGSGKSRAIAQKIIYRCLTETGTKENPFHHRIAVIRKYKTTIKQSVYEEIRQEIIQLGLKDLVNCNKSDFSFSFFNDAEIFCMGLDDEQKLKSLVSSSAWVEEATELDEADFSQLDLRYRGKAPYHKQIILSFNPIDESHWLKKVFFDKPQNGLTYILHTTYKDNKFIDEQYVKVLEEKFAFDPNLSRIYVNGLWGRIKRGSEFFFNFKYDKHVRSDIKYTRGVPLHISFDFNVNPHITAVVSQIVKRDIIVEKAPLQPFFFVNILDEICLTNPYNTTERLCDEIVMKFDNEMKWGTYIYGDATGKYTSTKSNVSDYDIIQEILRNYLTNYSMRVPKANPLIKIRRNFINKVLYGSYNIEVRVHERCKKLITDLESVLESEDGGVTKQMMRDPNSGVIAERYGHASDCFSYLICECFKGYYDVSF